MPAQRICAGRDNLAGNLQAWQGAGIGRHRIHTEPLQYVRPVDACSMDANENLGFPGFGNRHGYLLQDLGSARFTDSNGMHLGAGEVLRHGQTTGTPNNAA